ncbi:MAG: hypothetical protein ABA06_00565 [Parcubacteria bacterium C7867-001]|nr:MAG: hypothetical protein ABA06_00565 [Parcubacteria bacterium C7867-001]
MGYTTTYMKGMFWNIFFLVFFAVLVLFGYGWLYDNARTPDWISLGDFFLIVLAIFRLVRLVSYDLILHFFRDWLAKAPADSFLGTLSALVHCPWCTGLWFSGFVLFFYYATPFAWPIILMLALAALASILQILANLIGWTAESKKRSVVGQQNSTSTCG